MRTNIMTTYKELMSVKNDTRWPSSSQKVTPDIMVVDYTKKHGRREGLLYNNRIFFGYVNPSQQRKNEYDINREWILKTFPI